MSRSWRAEEFPAHAKWIEVNDSVIDRLVEGLQRVRFYSPQVPVKEYMMLNVLMTWASSSREIASFLVARAMFRAGHGDVDGAWQDLLICHRLARHAGKSGILVDRQLGVALDGIACWGDIALAQNASMMPGQAIKFARDLKAVKEIKGFADHIDIAERFTYLDFVSHLARGTPRVAKMLELNTQNTG